MRSVIQGLCRGDKVYATFNNGAKTIHKRVTFKNIEPGRPEMALVEYSKFCHILLPLKDLRIKL